MQHALPAEPVPPDTSQTDPASGLAWTGGGPVAEDTGKVFFKLDGTDYVCSGVALAPPPSDPAAHEVVVTAAHCVSDSYGGWATEWTFVPGYQNGNEPYGSFTASKFFVSRQWNAGMNESYDLAFIPMPGLSHGLPVAFGQTPGSAYVFGYPTEPPFDGQSLTYCAGPVHGDPLDRYADAGMPCAMTAGDSGGPWLSGFSPTTGTGTVVGISAFKYSDNDQILYGATFGSLARSLYEQAATAPTR